MGVALPHVVVGAPPTNPWQHRGMYWVPTTSNGRSTPVITSQSGRAMARACVNVPPHIHLGIDTSTRLLDLTSTNMDLNCARLQEVDPHVVDCG